MKLNKLISKKGFTLIELIIALSIISIVSMGFFTIINSNIKHNLKNEIDIKALNIAQTEIEYIRNCIKSNTNIIINNENILFDDTNPTIEKVYIKSIYEDNTEYKYEINLNLSREERSNNYENKPDNTLYLYDIKLEIKAENENLSKKITTLNTQVLSK